MIVEGRVDHAAQHDDRDAGGEHLKAGEGLEARGVGQVEVEQDDGDIELAERNRRLAEAANVVKIEFGRGDRQEGLSDEGGIDQVILDQEDLERPGRARRGEHGSRPHTCLGWRARFVSKRFPRRMQL